MAQRIIFPKKSEVALEDFTPPSVGAGEVAVKTLASLISIGTESTVLHQRYAEESHFADMFSFPQLQTGNQAVGIIERVGDGVEGIKEGDRVFFRKAHASHWAAQASECALIPSGMDISTAIWCGFAKIAFRAAQTVPFKLGEETLVVGAGPVGQMAVRWALAAGMKRVVLCDLSEKRLSLAPDRVETRLGSVKDQYGDLLALSGGEGFSSIIDSTGNPDVFKDALSLAAVFGKVILLGDTGFPAKQRLTSDAMTKGVSIIATHEQLDRDGWSQPAVDALYFELAQAGSIDARGLITHTFAPSQYKEAYDIACGRREEAVGVMFDWDLNNL